MEKNNYRFTSLYGGMEIDTDMDTTSGIGDNVLANYIKILLQFRTDIKMYHWQTKSFAYHKISDELLTSIDDLTDKLVENICGLLNTRPEMNTTTQINISNILEKNVFISKGKDVEKKLRALDVVFRSKSEILNIRDELVGSINKALYLLSFD